MLGDAGLAPGALAMAGGQVVAEAPEGARCFDATGLLVLPGVVDIHGDAHERAFQPRPGVDFSPGFALADSARQLLAAGITTACLGVTLSWEPGLRSLAAFRALDDALDAARAATPGDLLIHLRFEADNFAAIPTALAALAGGRIAVLGFNDHTPGIVRKLGDPVQLSKYAGRAGVSAKVFADLAAEAMARRDEVPAARALLAEAARAAGVAMLSHDDASLEDRAEFRALGAHICEFPMAEAVAAEARTKGESVVMGAPNVVRGGSHLGWASAAPLAERGLVTVLASDYVWPALSLAPFVLADRGVMDLAAAWALVSANPAAALGLADRGGLAPDMRGDAVVMDRGTRSVVATFARGQLGWLAAGAAGRLG
ncbi:alpha-D-ribose 1-methylphosphonate 5-triphosphate diphosphatase [Humitalea rosea]|uniref:Alpha-D-ribose 1-methylphosphonate 5-triphosphate diphosphatase n=2 Tax=Humitalea rosea TaxID=990373 RepID=A0A2W7JEI6_9PROT|nr:alpha-D-ribose 1-methylphosphonate 5-triphosphate diphosphatase [Humitalea rosea]